MKILIFSFVIFTAAAHADRRSDLVEAIKLNDPYYQNLNKFVVEGIQWDSDLIPEYGLLAADVDVLGCKATTESGSPCQGYDLLTFRSFARKFIMPQLAASRIQSRLQGINATADRMMRLETLIESCSPRMNNFFAVPRANCAQFVTCTGEEAVQVAALVTELRSNSASFRTPAPEEIRFSNNRGKQIDLGPIFSNASLPHGAPNRVDNVSLYSEDSSGPSGFEVHLGYSLSGRMAPREINCRSDGVPRCQLLISDTSSQNKRLNLEGTAPSIETSCLAPAPTRRGAVSDGERSSEGPVSEPPAPVTVPESAAGVVN